MPTPTSGRRSRSTSLVAALLALAAGCKSQPSRAPTASPSRDANDRLLALAPSDIRTALVVSGRALGFAEAALARGRALARTDPGLERAAADVDRKLDAALGRPAGPPLERLAQLGLTTDRGFARFELADERVITIWPVGDRAAFVAAFHGQQGPDGVDTIEVGGAAQRCRVTQDVYACADDLAALARLGTGPLAGTPARAGARGDVEVVTRARPDADGPFEDMVATVALEPGQLVARAWIAAALAGPLAALADEHVQLDPGRASGFAGIAIPQALLAGAGGGNPVVAVAATMRRITAVVPSGITDVDVRVPLTSTDAARALLARCDQLPLPAQLTATRDGDACVVTSTEGVAFTATARLEGDTLRLSRTGGAVAAATGPAPTALGRELAAGTWTAVFWGRGTGLAVPGGSPWSRPGGGGATDVAVRALAYLTELGVGVRIERDGAALMLVVRTAHANPAAVVDALAPLVARAAAGADVAAEVRALAAAHPTSPLADDVAAGTTGLTVPAAVMGLLAAVVIPKFLDYQQRGRRSEAELNLEAIAKFSKATFAEEGTFPVGTAALTPAQPCCAYPGHQCPAVASDWVGVPAWDALGFEQTEPSFFQYAYTSDGQTYEARAVGDLDCDGTPVTYVVRGRVGADGVPTHELQKPTTAD